MSGKAKLTPEIKTELVERYLKGELSLLKASQEAGVHNHSFRDWIRIYETEGPSGLLVKTQKTYLPNEIKLSAVKSYLSGEGSLRDICTKYKIRNESQLRVWIKKYNSHEDFKSYKGGSYMGKAGCKKKARRTTQDERFVIVQACLSNHKKYSATALKYNVSDQQVKNWVRRYEKMGVAGLEDRRGHRAGTQTGRTPEEIMRDRISQLEREKKDLQMENDLLKKVRELERGSHYL